MLVSLAAIPIRRLATALTVAALALGLALGAPGSAFAMPNAGGGTQKSCVDADGKTHAHGSILTTYIRVGSRKRVAYKYKCNNGNWESVPA